MTEPSDLEPRWKTAVPFTYIIDYAPDHVGNDGYLKEVADAPPVLLHVCQDVPFKGAYGPGDGFSYFSSRLLYPSEVEQRIITLKEYISQLHRLGVKLVIPYVSSIFIFGNRDKRTGFWEFYDKWERYCEFGFGSKPKQDPITWCCEKPRPIEVEGSFVYEPCINNPDWRRFLRTIVGHIAKVGFDGVFMDVNSSSCRRSCCRKLFRQYLQAAYSGGEITKLFGFRTPGDVRLGQRGEGLLWGETVRFRGERMANLFSELRSEGRKYRDTFFVLPNLSPYQHVDGVWKRVGNSQVFDAWARECPVIMFEEVQQPGLFAEGVVSNFVFQYKYAFAHRARAGCLLSNALDSWGVQIAIAEAGAGGGGAFIQCGYTCPEVRRRYRAFFRDRAALFEGYEPYASTGLIFSSEQLAWGGRSHIENAYRVAEELTAQHVLFDLIVQRDIGSDALARHNVIIASDLENLSDLQAQAILDYVRSGGRLVVIGNLGTHDDLGSPREGGVLGADPDWKLLSRGIQECSYGEGVCLKADVLDRLLSPAAFELFMLPESEINDINIVFERLKGVEGKPREDRRREFVAHMGRIAGQVSISDCGETLRFNAYRRADEHGSSLVLHAVNYNIPIHGRGQSGPAIPTEHVRVDLHLPLGLETVDVRAYNPPDEAAAGLDFDQRGRSLAFEIGHVDVYSVIHVKANPPEAKARPDG